MKQAFKYNALGEFVEPILIEPNNDGEYELPKDCTFKELPQPNWKPVFTNGAWVETATEEEKNPPVNVEPSPMEKLQQEQALMRQALDELILGGGGL